MRSRSILQNRPEANYTAYVQHIKTIEAHKAITHTDTLIKTITNIISKKAFNVPQRNKSLQFVLQFVPVARCIVPISINPINIYESLV